jgi:hypothetical protein
MTDCKGSIKTQRGIVPWIHFAPETRLLTLEIPADIAERPAAERDAAFAALLDQLRQAEREEDGS